MSPPFAARGLCFLGILLFWAGVLAAGSLVSGYSARSDFISSLAGRGSPVAALAIAALLASATAHVAAARAVATAWRSRLTAGCLVAAGVAVVAAAGFRVSCPDGPAGCGGSDSTSDWVDIVHAVSVAFYQLFLLAAMVSVASGLVRARPAWPRWLAWVSVVAAVASLVLVDRVGGASAGLWQRLWLADNLAWLAITAAATGTRSLTSARRRTAEASTPAPARSAGRRVWTAGSRRRRRQ